MRTQRSGRGLHNVPAELTSFVGRRRELAEIKQRLGASRLVTLTGTGGVGKTRLALRAASELARAFPDGVWFVTLAPIEDPQLVTQAVFHALGLQDRSAGWPLSALTEYLAEKHMLLMLDNCEHLVDTCAVLATTLLKSCPELRLLATSRQPLGTAGEARMRVPSLALPDDGGLVAAERLVTFEGVALLVERAVAVMPGFRVDQTNAAEVLRLCQRLDGIPLALELAAGRLEGLSLARLNQGLDAELTVLGGANRGAEARQRTLDATIGWSYGLLDEEERHLWARLSVFAGSFDEDAVVHVCSDAALPSDRVIALLAALVEKSIVKRDPNLQPPRYELLETLRQYGRQRLRALGEEASAQKRHFDWMLAFAKLVGAFDRRQVEMFKRMDKERDNLWAALEFCLSQPGEAAAGAELAKHLVAYWTGRGPYGDLRRVLTSLAELTPEDSRPRAHLLWAAAAMASSQTDFDACTALSRESLRIGTQLNDAEVVAWSLNWVAISLWLVGNLAAAVERGQAALSIARSIHSRPIEIVVTAAFPHILLAAGLLDRTIQLCEDGLAISKDSGEVWMRGYVLNAMAQANWLRGERQRAEVQAQEGAACKHALDDRLGLPALLETLAWMAAERGASDRAATLLGSAEHVRRSGAMPFQEPYRQQHERSVAVAVEGLGQRAYDAAFNRGCAMTMDEGVAFAVEGKEPTTRQEPAAAVGSPIALTRREQEIATLVGQGMSNKQIAAKLIVSERTAEYHILNILNKLGFDSRTQIASWATANQPLPAGSKR